MVWSVISRRPSYVKIVHKVVKGELAIIQVISAIYTIKDRECHERGGSELYKGTRCIKLKNEISRREGADEGQMSDWPHRRQWCCWAKGHSQCPPYYKSRSQGLCSTFLSRKCHLSERVSIIAQPHWAYLAWDVYWRSPLDPWMSSLSCSYLYSGLGLLHPSKGQIAQFLLQHHYRVHCSLVSSLLSQISQHKMLIKTL